MRWTGRAALLALVPGVWVPGVLAQETGVPDADKGKVVFSTDNRQQSPAAPADAFPRQSVTNEERSSVAVVSLDLDLHLTPVESRAEGHALITLRNVSSAPVGRVALQVSSTLRWSSFTTLDRRPKPIAFTQSPVTTDADHTGYAQEAVLTLEHPLAPGATVAVAAFYAGQIPPSTARLELLGTPQAKAAETDWDGIVPTNDDGATGLRGYGEVLWYPVAGPTAVLGEGNELFEAIGRQKLANETATMHLRLTVVYEGDPPDAVIFNGRLHSLAQVPDTINQVVDESHGVATADFPMAPIGFRTPSLFLTAQKPEGSGAFLTVISPVPEAATPYAQAASRLELLFTDWIGEDIVTPLLLLEHPGAPFEDGVFIAAHLSESARPDTIGPELVRALTHAYFSATTPANVWLDQGMPEFMGLLWTERRDGREAVIRQLQHDALPIALASPDLANDTSLEGEPLVHASSDVALRLKAAAVLWQLREMLGEEAFRRGIKAYRKALTLNLKGNAEPDSFERSLEKTTGKDLRWFFDDWVYHDRGLPDLTVTHVSPRPLPAKGGLSGGYLVAVEVRNDGFAAAEVPVTVSAGATISVTERLRVPAHGSASTRILFQGKPVQLQVNDGNVPEQRSSIHVVPIVVTPELPPGSRP